MSLIPIGSGCNYTGTHIEATYENVIIDMWARRKVTVTAAEETLKQTAKLNEMYYPSKNHHALVPSASEDTEDEEIVIDRSAISLLEKKASSFGRIRISPRALQNVMSTCTESYYILNKDDDSE